MTIVQMGRITATEAGDRNATALMLPSDGTQLGTLQGVQAGLVLTKTSGMGWQLDLGRCSISPATAANGPVVAAITVAETGSFAAGDATRDRIDIVGLQIDETATTGNGNPPVKTVLIQGAYPASGSPVAPAIPAGTVGLWQVKIAAGTSAGGGGWNTANLVDIRPWLYTNSGLSYSAVNTSDTNWTYTGGLWKSKTPNGPDMVELALRLKRTGGAFTVSSGSSFLQAFSGLIPAGYRPVTFNFYAWVPLVDGSENPVAQLLYRIDSSGNLFFNANSSTTFGTNSQVTIQATWPAA